MNNRFHSYTNTKSPTFDLVSFFFSSFFFSSLALVMVALVAAAFTVAFLLFTGTAAFRTVGSVGSSPDPDPDPEFSPEPKSPLSASFASPSFVEPDSESAIFDFCSASKQ